MPIKPLNRRTILRGAGAAIALPFLEAMLPPLVTAQEPVKRFYGFLYPNGIKLSDWRVSSGDLDASALSPALEGLAGFDGDTGYPGQGSLLDKVTVIKGIDHSDIARDIHSACLSMCAYRPSGPSPYLPLVATFDQILDEHLGGKGVMVTRGTGPGDDAKLFSISYRAVAGGVPQGVQPEESPQRLFDRIFGDGTPEPEVSEAPRRQRMMDAIRRDARRLERQVGGADRQRLQQYFNAIDELERDIQEMSTTRSCDTNGLEISGGSAHAKNKAFTDIMVLAMACDMKRVAAQQYGHSFILDYNGVNIGEGHESLRGQTDHRVSHETASDGAQDLANIENRSLVAAARYRHAAQFKIRRFAYVIDRLKAYDLLDSTLALFLTDSNERTHRHSPMPTLVAGNAGGFRTGRCVDIGEAPTATLHASLAHYYGLDLGRYGDPVGSRDDRI